MLNRVMQTIEQHQLLLPGELVLVAVSGGPDSVALLHWLYSQQMSLQIRLACAHYNHGFRDQESDEDEAFVAEFCHKWGIPYYHKKEDLKVLIEEGGANLQDVAREYRYRFLLETAIECGASRVALAHHADDQVETILMRFLRGTGTTGMVGMPYLRPLSKYVTAIRPFLDLAKDEILAYMKLHELPSRIDSSNLKVDYIRNRIRLQLVPQLRDYNSNFSSSILTLARMLKEDEDELIRLAQQHFEQITNVQRQRCGEEILLSIPEFLGLPLSLQRRIIKLICNYLSKNEEEVPFLHIEALRSLFMQNRPRQWDLPWAIHVYVRYGEALFTRQPIDSTDDGFHCAFVAPATIHIPQIEGRVTCSIVSRIAEAESLYTVYFDFDRIGANLLLRMRQQGDRLRLEGLGAHKKVKDIFIDNKIPREDRNKIPLLFADGELLWIVGVRKSAVGKYDHHTKRFLRCSFEYETD